MSTTSMGSPPPVMAFVAGTSALDGDSVSASRPFGSARSLSIRPPPRSSDSACARCCAVSAGLLTMNASGSSNTTSYLSAGSDRWICAPAAREMSRRAGAPPVSTRTRIFFTRSPSAPRRGVTRRSGWPRDGEWWGPASARSDRCDGAGGGANPERGHPGAAAGPQAVAREQASPLAHQFDFGDEVDAELRFHFRAAAVHQRLHILGARITDVHDEVRVLRAHHRAALGHPLEAGGLDETAGVISRRVAEDRAGVGLRERLFGHALVRDLFDALHRGVAVPCGPAEPRAHDNRRRALKRRGA